MSQSVCLSVREHIAGTAPPNSTNFPGVHVVHNRGSIVDRLLAPLQYVTYFRFSEYSHVFLVWNYGLNGVVSLPQQRRVWANAPVWH